MVVFGRDIIIFSIKSCAFQNTGDLNTDWKRWCKRAILESAEQIYGAVKWIKNHPNKVFLDKEVSHPLPIELPPIAECRFHRIVIALNASERCSSYFNGDSGSLMILPHLKGNAHIDEANPGYFPFSVGQLNPSKGFIHVLDDVTLDIILRELDTVSDFVNYLSRKEKFVCSGQLGAAAGEEELLAYYLTHINENKEHDFVFQEDKIVIGKGLWEDYERDPQYIAKKQADKISYLWDSLIELFIQKDKSIIGDGLSMSNHKPVITDYEKAVRILASEGRVSRRMLMMSIINLIKTNSTDMVRVIMPSLKNNHRAYIILLCPNPSDAVSIEKRISCFNCYGQVLKSKSPQFTEIVGITIQGTQGNFSPKDLFYLNTEGWTPEDNIEAQKIQQQLGILLDGSGRGSSEKFHIEEYPGF